MSPYREQAENEEGPKAYFPHDNGLFFFDNLVEVDVERTGHGYEENPVVQVVLQNGRVIKYRNWRPLSVATDSYTHEDRVARIKENFREAKLFAEWIAKKKQRWSEHLAMLSRPLPSFEQEASTKCESE